VLRGRTLTLSSATLLCACQLLGAGGDAPPDLDGTAWKATEIGGGAVHEAIASTLRIGEEGSMSGSAGCNRFFGTLSLEGDRVSVGPLGSTRMMCAPPVMEQEQRFFQALEGAGRLERRGDELIFFGEGDAATLRLARTEGA
jgi:putative lipoprotein